MAREFKLDIFALLEAINRGDREFFRKLDAEQKKGFAPIVVERWLTGTSDAAQIVGINHYVNPYVFSPTISKIPDLMFDLMIAASSRKPGRRYYWLPQSKSSKKQYSIAVLQEFFGYSEREAWIQLPYHYHDYLITLAEELGWDKEKINALKKEAK